MPRKFLNETDSVADPLSPWGLNESSPYGAEWTLVVVPTRGPIKKVSLKNSAGVEITSEKFSTNDARLKSDQNEPLGDVSALRDYWLLCNAVNACTKVRPQWDATVAQTIVPIFAAAAGLDLVHKTLKQQSMESTFGPWIEIIASELDRAWPEKAREEYKKRNYKDNKKEKPEQHFVVQEISPHQIQIASQQGQRVLLSLTDPREVVLKRAGQATLSRGDEYNHLTISEREQIAARASQDTKVAYAYWRAITESMNSFMHLDSNVGLPDSYPVLVGALRRSRADIFRVANIFNGGGPQETGINSRLLRIAESLKRSFECIDYPKNRMHQLLEMSDKERDNAYRQLDKRYKSLSSGPTISAPSHQMLLPGFPGVSEKVAPHRADVLKPPKTTKFTRH